jgi:uncharacterized protein
MKVILDTNILLVSIPRKSKYRIIFEKLLSGKFELIISNDVLFEYVEIIGEKANPVVAGNIAELLLSLPNVHSVDIFYTWNVIPNDPSDNKFVDAAISGDADYIVTNDRHPVLAVSPERDAAFKCSAQRPLRETLRRQNLGGITKDGVKYHLNKLKEDGVVVRVGGSRGGYWKIIK